MESACTNFHDKNNKGYFVLTPLDRAGNQGTIIVNRGWIPLGYEKQNIPWDRPQGTVDLVGVTTQAERK